MLRRGSRSPTKPRNTSRRSSSSRRNHPQLPYGNRQMSSFPCGQKLPLIAHDRLRRSQRLERGRGKTACRRRNHPPPVSFSRKREAAMRSCGLGPSLGSPYLNHKPNHKDPCGASSYGSPRRSPARPVRRRAQRQPRRSEPRRRRREREKSGWRNGQPERSRMRQKSSRNAATAHR